MVKDDLIVIRQTLQDCSAQERHRLVNGKFTDADDMHKELTDSTTFAIGYKSLEQPDVWTLAVAYRASHETLQELLKHGVDITSTNCQGNNGLHIMVVLACLQPQLEDYLMSVYSLLQDNVLPQTVRRALFTENEDGFRPLELASVCATCGLFQSFFCTTGVYISAEVRRGLCTKQYFDITDYGSRRLKSPLILFGLLDKAAARNRNTDVLFTTEYFNEWITKR